MDKTSSSSEQGGEDHWIESVFEQDTEINEYDKEQREHMVSIMQRIQFGGSLFDQTWPEWIISR